MEFEILMTGMLKMLNFKLRSPFGRLEIKGQERGSMSVFHDKSDEF
jgi:hypothetical protein